MKVQNQAVVPRNLVWCGALLLLLTGIYNSIQISSDSYMHEDVGIKFVKRLDEMNGKITKGWMATSAVKWTALAQRKKIRKAQVSPIKPALISDVSKNEVVGPAIDKDLDLSLEHVFFKKPLKKGSFSGSARTVDGFIEEVVVNLPDGKVLYIDTRDRMVGNVFQFEDTQTGELKSGMFYEVKKGKQYMITLTNDSEYSGLRLGFKTNGYAEVNYNDTYGNNQNINWEDSSEQRLPANSDMDEQAQEVEVTPTSEGGYAFNFEDNGTQN